MPSYAPAVVTEILTERPGLQRILTARHEGGPTEKAYVLTDLIGEVTLGDKVIMNTTAVELGLGTGGWHVVHWNLQRDHWAQSGPGHIMKLRYTTTQVDTGAAEETTPATSRPADGRPVVVCQLHSQAAAAAVVIHRRTPDARITYVMTDQAALPLAISDVMYELRRRVIVSRTITAGQAFGGDLEAVNVASAIDIAFDDGADIVIVGQGPGVVGTNSKLGFSGLEAVHHLRDAKLAGAVPIFCLRWSEADPRVRHRGLSHHSATVLERSADDVVYGMPRSHGDRAIFAGDARVVDVPDMAELLGDLDLEIRTMGRTVEQDRAFFAFAAASGVVATDVLAEREQ